MQAGMDIWPLTGLMHISTTLDVGACTTHCPSLLHHMHCMPGTAYESETRACNPAKWHSNFPQSKASITVDALHVAMATDAGWPCHAASTTSCMPCLSHVAHTEHMSAIGTCLAV